MHELYLWPFQDALKAGAANIMCAYNRVNNSYACQNSKILNGLLKTELGFEGFVVTDWNAQHAGVAAALAGLDMAMPDGQSFWGNNFTEAFTNGSVPESRLDDMAIRYEILRLVAAIPINVPNISVGSLLLGINSARMTRAFRSLESGCPITSAGLTIS